MASSKLVTSKIASSVQELVKEPMLSIPKHYVQEDQEPSILLDDGTSLPTVPVINMKHLIIEEDKDCELEKLHSACKDWGIFQLVNHGVDSSLVEKLKYEIEEFYKLPLEEKMKYKMRPGDVEGFGQSILFSEDQKVDWADRFYFFTNPIHRRKPHLLPQLPSSLRDTMESYISELQKVAKTLIGLMAKALRIDEEEIEELFEDGIQSVRMTYYPPCPKPELVVGLTPHSDASAITILLQLNGVDSLQVKKDGVWIPTNFLPGAFMVNVGDLLEITSNGVYQSIEHRVTVNPVKERISIAMFFSSNPQAKVGPATSITNSDNPPLFKRVEMEKYVQAFFARKLYGKSFLDQMRIENGEQHTT